MSYTEIQQISAQGIPTIEYRAEPTEPIVLNESNLILSLDFLTTNMRIILPNMSFVNKLSSFHNGKNVRSINTISLIYMMFIIYVH